MYVLFAKVSKLNEAKKICDLKNVDFNIKCRLTDLRIVTSHCLFRIAIADRLLIDLEKKKHVANTRN